MVATQIRPSAASAMAAMRSPLRLAGFLGS